MVWPQGNFPVLNAMYPIFLTRIFQCDLLAVESFEFSFVPSEISSNIRQTGTRTHTHTRTRARTHTSQPSVTESGVYEGEITAEELYMFMSSGIFKFLHNWSKLFVICLIFPIPKLV